MTDTARLPLFPLPMVAAPSEIVALHIFEERYKAMIEACRADQASGGLGEFVLLQQQDGQAAAVGTALRLSSVLQTYENGSMDILATGTRRCRILGRHEGKAFAEADIVWVFDDDKDWTESLATEAFQLHQTLIQMTTGFAPPDSFYSGKFLLSFALMASLGLCPGDKQILLEMNNEDDRLRFLVAKIRRSIRVIECAQSIQESAQSWWNLNRVVRKWKTTKPS